jgi:hypothetical protein
MLGLFLGALLAGALTNILEFEPQELTIMKILEREQARQVARELAISKLKARLTHYVIRFRARKALRENELSEESASGSLTTTSVRLYSDATELTGRLRRMQQVLRKDANDFLSDTYKIDRLYHRVKFASNTVKSICHKLSDPGVLTDCLGRRVRESLHRSSVSVAGRSDSGQRAVIWDKKKKQFIVMKGESNPDAAIPMALSDGARRAKAALKGHLRRLKAAKTFTDGAAAAGQVSIKTAPAAQLLEIPSTFGMWQLKTTSAATAVRPTMGNISDLVDSDSFAVRRDDWRKDKLEIISRWERTRKFAAVVGIVGSLSAMWQNEIVVSGDGTLLSLNLLKALNSVCSILCGLAVIRAYWLRVTLTRLLDHVHKFVHHDDKVPIYTLFLRKTLWLELFIVAVHCPPGLEMGIGSRFLQNFVAYRIETVMCCWNMLRAYLVWRAVEDWML